MRQLHFAFLAALLGITGTTNAYAHDSFGFSLNIGVPAYYSAPPVYFEPAPVYYSAPPGYYAPAPVYYAPYGARVFFNDGGPRFHRFHDDDHHGWRRHHRHDDDD